MAHDTNGEMPYRRMETVPSGLRTAALVLTAIGAIGLIAAFLIEPARAWRAYYINWLYFMGVAQGAVLVSVVVSITTGMWARPLRRISLSFAAFMPIAFIMMIPIFIGAGHIWPWVSEPSLLSPGKEAWLNVPFLTARTILGMAVLVALDLAFAYHALRPDLGLIRDRIPESLKPLHGWMTRNWRGQETEEIQSFKKMQVLSAFLVVVYAIVMGTIGWDFVMSLEPHWFSTLIGPYFFMGAFLTGLMVTGVIALRYRSGFGLQQWITEKNMHDLGKLCFGFTVFWGYLFFSQYIVIWYGLLPIEQSFVIHRFSAPFVWIAYLVGLCVFALPFFGLLGVTAKKRPEFFTLFASISLFGMWLERYLLVYPSLWTGTKDLPLSWQEPAVALLFLGLMMGAHTWFAARFPMLQMWTPPSEVELSGITMELSETATVR